MTDRRPPLSPSPGTLRRAVVIVDGLDRRRRLQPSDDHPAFQTVNGRPVLDHVVRWLARQGVTDVCLVLHHLPGLVAHYFMDGAAWGVRVTYVYQERPLGSGGALAQTAGFSSETVLLLSGTMLTDAELRPMITAHMASGAGVSAAIGTVRGARVRPHVVLDEDDRLTDYDFPRASDPVSAEEATDVGLYLVEPEIVRGLAGDSVLDWRRDVLAPLVAVRRVTGWRTDAAFVVVNGEPATLPVIGSEDSV